MRRLLEAITALLTALTGARKWSRDSPPVDEPCSGVRLADLHDPHNIDGRYL